MGDVQGVVDQWRYYLQMVCNRGTRAGYANGAEEIVFRWSGMWTRKLNAKQKDGDI